MKAPANDDAEEAAPLDTTFAAPLHVLASRIGLARRSLEEFIQRGCGPPFFMLGRHRYALRSEFEKWLARVASGEIDTRRQVPRVRRLQPGEAPTPERRKRRSVPHQRR